MSTVITDLLGLAAAALVLVTFSVRSPLALRCFAIASNLLFVGYGIAGHLLPILVLHAVLLPLNLCRLWQLRRAAAVPVGTSGSEQPSGPCRPMARRAKRRQGPEADPAGRRPTGGRCFSRRCELPDERRAVAVAVRRCSGNAQSKGDRE